MKKITTRIILCVLGCFLATTIMARMRTNQMDLVQVAMGNDQFTTFVTALSSAGLVDELQQPGPFTVFAPTNDAFGKLPEGALQDLLNNPDQLRQVLLYHVVQGQIVSSDIQEGQTQVQTLQGDSLTINKDNDSVKINGNVEVIQGDLMADNGVIHVIDTVLMPSNTSDTSNM